MFSFGWEFLLYDKPNGTAEILMAPIERYLKERTEYFYYEMRAAETDAYAWMNQRHATGRFAMGSRLLSAKSLSNPIVTAEVFAAIGQSMDPSNPDVSLSDYSPLDETLNLRDQGPDSETVISGYLVAHPNAPTYHPDVISMNPAWRNTLVHLVVFKSWKPNTPQTLIDAASEAMTHNTTEALRKLSPETGAYFNEADPYEPDWQQAFFGKNYDRLKEIKEKYDPNHVLWCRQCVGSENLVEHEDGKMCPTDLPMANNGENSKDAQGEKKRGLLL